MKTIMLGLVVALTSVVAHAQSDKVTTFNCRLDKYASEVVSFQMKNLDQGDMQVLSIDADDDYSGIFASTSEDDMISHLVSTINGQGGDLRVSQDRITFFGDDDGIDFAYFVLFKDSGYTRGYVRMAFDFDSELDYSLVSCSKQVLP